MKSCKILALTALLFILIGCSYDSEDDLVEATDPTDPAPTVVTYDANIATIINSACTGCHSAPPVNGAPNSFVNYSQVEQRANAILSRMQLQNGAPGAMPPSGRLPQLAIDAVEQWIADGKLEN